MKFFLSAYSIPLMDQLSEKIGGRQIFIWPLDRQSWSAGGFSAGRPTGGGGGGKLDI